MMHTHNAGQIQRTLGAQRIACRVIEVVLSPGVVRYRLSLAWGVKVAAIEARARDIAHALGVRAVRIAQDADGIYVEMPRDDGKVIYFADVAAQSGTQRGRATAILGIAADGAPLLLRLDSATVVHVLIAGMTGCGKTELMRTMLASLAGWHRPAMMQFCICDIGARLHDVVPAASMWQGRAPAFNDDQCAAALRAVRHELDRRQPGALPRLIVAVDELAALSDMPAAQDAIVALTQRGRAKNMHVIAGTQRPSALAIGSETRANFPVRLVGRCGTVEDARIAAGRRGTGAETLEGNGAFLLVGGGEIIRFQAAIAPPPAENTAGLVPWDAVTTVTTVATVATELAPGTELAVIGRPNAVATVEGVEDDAAILAELRDGRWRRPIATETQRAAVRRLHRSMGGSVAATIRALGWSYDGRACEQVKRAVKGA